MVTVTGKAEVRAYIGGIPAKMRGVLVGAAKAGAQVFADNIEELTPSQDVRDNLRVTSKTKEGAVSARVGLKTKWAASVAVWLEYGTSPHFISVDESQREGRSVGRINRLGKEDGREGSLVIAGQFVGSTVFHPGARPFPAFRPALDFNQVEAVTAAQAYINRAVSRGRISEGDTA